MSYGNGWNDIGELRNKAESYNKIPLSEVEEKVEW